MSPFVKRLFSVRASCLALDTLLAPWSNYSYFPIKEGGSEHLENAWNAFQLDKKLEIDFVGILLSYCTIATSYVNLYFKFIYLSVILFVMFNL